MSSTVKSMTDWVNQSAVASFIKVHVLPAMAIAFVAVLIRAPGISAGAGSGPASPVLLPLWRFYDSPDGALSCDWAAFFTRWLGLTVAFFLLLLSLRAIGALFQAFMSHFESNAPEVNMLSGFLMSKPKLLLMRLLIIGSVVLLFAIAVRYVFFPGSRVDVKNGLIEFSSLGGERQVVFALHPAQGFADTGIAVAKGDQLRFAVSGSINLAMHRTAEAAIIDEEPPFPWIFRPGLMSVTKPQDQRRTRTLLLPSAEQGSVLAYVCCHGQVCPDLTKPATLEATLPSRLMVAAKAQALSSEQTIKAQCDGRLFLTVNDNYVRTPTDYIGSLEDYIAEEHNEIAKLRSNPALRWQALTGWALEAACYLQSCPDLVKVCWKMDRKYFQDNNPDTLRQNLENDWAQGCKDPKSPPSDVNGLIQTTWETLQNDSTPKFKSEQGYATLACIRDFSRWEHAVKHYPRLWFDDNEGLFLVTIKIGE